MRGEKEAGGGGSLDHSAGRRKERSERGEEEERERNKGGQDFLSILSFDLSSRVLTTPFKLLWLQSIFSFFIFAHFAKNIIKSSIK